LPTKDGDAEVEIKIMSINTSDRYGKPLEFCNQDAALHATLRINDKLSAEAERGIKITFVELICDVFDKCGQLP
jgi:hypothetical protein